MSRLHILFVCGRNQKRSPTAERLYRSDPRFSVRSAGTSDSSRRRVQYDDLVWADLILVMEPRYMARIEARFSNFESLPPFRSLDIPDDYEFMDQDLLDLLSQNVETAVHEYHTGPDRARRYQATSSAMSHPDWVTDEQHWLGNCAGVVSTCRAYLSGDSRLIESSRELVGYAHRLRKTEDSDFMFFIAVDSATDHLPVGKAREDWAADALRKKDVEARAIEDFYQKDARIAASSLLAKFTIHDRDAAAPI